MDASLKLSIKSILDEIRTEAPGNWANPNSTFYGIRILSIDKRGSFGERVFVHLLSNALPAVRRLIYNDGDQGDWDVSVNGIRFEIKTSSIDVNNKFQNEGLKADGDYEAVFFLGITPERLYFKLTKKEDIPFSNLHNRGERGTGRGHKWDFKISDMVELVDIDTFAQEFTSIFLE